MKKLEINLPITAIIITTVPTIGCPFNTAILAPNVSAAARLSPKTLNLFDVG